MSLSTQDLMLKTVTELDEIMDALVEKHTFFAPELKEMQAVYRERLQRMVAPRPHNRLEATICRLEKAYRDLEEAHARREVAAIPRRLRARKTIGCTGCRNGF
jgi:hypothetical protein